MVLKLTIQ